MRTLSLNVISPLATSILTTQMDGVDVESTTRIPATVKYIPDLSTCLPDGTVVGRLYVHFYVIAEGELTGFYFYNLIVNLLMWQSCYHLNSTMRHHST